MSNVNGFSVCKDCKKRELYCHATCETYLQAKQEYEDRKQTLKKQKQQQVDYMAYVADNHNRIKKYLRNQSR